MKKTDRRQNTIEDLPLKGRQAACGGGIPKQGEKHQQTRDRQTLDSNFSRHAQPGEQDRWKAVTPGGGT